MTDSKIPPHEIAMQQAWRFRLWRSGALCTTQGKKIHVIDPGKLNAGPGPDFKDAKINIDGSLWVGCVEIHRYASDWHRHGHDRDKAYDNVILHVVGNDDCRIHRNDGSEILQAVMSVGNGFASMFNGLLNGKRLVLPMCGDSLRNVEDVFKTDWITALAFERLIRKAEDVQMRLKAEAGNWFQAVFVTLARGLGFGSNADNMERMARSIPFKYLLRSADNIDTVEALLFGQAGLLNHNNPADYHEADLVREYNFYAHKYGLRPIENPIWQLSVRNIANTPHRRIALLAKLVCTHGTDLGSRLCERFRLSDARSFLNVDMSEYWINTYAFGRTSPKRMVGLGKQSQDLLIINVLAPLIYCRGLETGRTDLIDGAIDIWESVEAESNGIVRGFEDFGVKARNAFTSQALIQLHKEYCERRRCTDCRIGHRLLSGHISFR